MTIRTLLILFALCCLPTVSAQRVALRTNLLLWGTTTPNLGAEVALGRKFTASVTGGYNAWKFPEEMKLNTYLIHPELRYWFCRGFEKHFIGIQGQYGHFNIGKLPFVPTMKEIIYRGDFYSGGVSYGYQWAFGDRWGMEAMLGVGYAYLRYDKFRCVDCAERIGSYTRHHYGPTSAGLSLIYFIR